MKVILLTNHSIAIPTLQRLVAKGWVQAVVSTDEINQYHLQIEQLVQDLSIPFQRFGREKLTSNFKDWLTKLKPDLVLVYSFKFKIPKEILNIPIYGFLNVHYSLLPFYRGAAPVFWQIKNGEANSGITVHQMDEGFDTGPILQQQEIPVFPGENHGLYTTRLSLLAVSLVEETLRKIEEGSLVPKTQEKHSGSNDLKPKAKDLTINWEKQSADEIERLVNACNPVYGGAISMFRNQQIKVLEVSPASSAEKITLAPGTIINADVSHGIFVACGDGECLRINVMQFQEGFFSGSKAAAIGIRAGERFYSVYNEEIEFAN